MSTSAHGVRLFRNEAGRLAAVGAAIGLTMPKRSARRTNWVDVDNDGDLDVYATDRAGPNQVYRNDGDFDLFVGHTRQALIRISYSNHGSTV